MYFIWIGMLHKWARKFTDLLEVGYGSIIFQEQDFQQMDPTAILGFQTRWYSLFQTRVMMISNSMIVQNWHMQQKKPDQAGNIGSHKDVQHKTPAKINKLY